MKRRRFLAPYGIPARGEIVLEGSEARHLASVLRLGPNDPIVVIDGRGHFVEATVTKVDPKRSKVVATPVSPVYYRDDRRPIVLLISPIRAEKMDLLVRQATECGVHTILPILSGRTVVHPKKERIERLREIAFQALKQCHGLHAPEILPPIPLNQVEQALCHTGLEPTSRFLLSPGKTATPLVTLALQKRPPWAIVIGPEGGLTDREKSFLKEIGFLEANLGPRILRTETASTVTIGILSNCQEIVVDGVRYHEVSFSKFSG